MKENDVSVLYRYLPLIYTIIYRIETNQLKN